MTARAEVRFRLPAPPLRPFITNYHFCDFSSDEGRVADCLAPEWGCIRVIRDGTMHARIEGGAAEAPIASLTGATTRALHLEGSRVRMIGVGLLPLGWVAFARVSASDYADRYRPLADDPAVAPLARLAEPLVHLPDDDAIVAHLDAALLALLPDAVRDRDLIAAVHEVLLDPGVNSAGQLGERVGLPPERLARLTLRAFGFTPQKLIKRQRFLRTLARVLLDPGRSWSETLDDAYYDQAQFTRDFKAAMGLTPREYLAMPHPIIAAAAQARQAAMGAPLQGLHRPLPAAP